MPASSMLFYNGLGIIGAIAVVMSLASALTGFTSLLLLHLYRRRVGQLMTTHADEAVRSGITGTLPLPATLALHYPAPEPACEFSGVQTNGQVDTATFLHRRVIYWPWKCALFHAGAGFLFAMVMAISYWIASSQPQPNIVAQFSAARLCFLFWLFAWPIVLTTNMIAAPTRRTRLGVVLTYFVVFGVLGGLEAVRSAEPATKWGNLEFPAWSDETPIRAVGQWFVLNLVPTLALLMVLNSRIRAVGPLVLGFMTVLATGVLGVVGILLYEVTSWRAVSFVRFFSVVLGTGANWAVALYFLVPTAIACMMFGAISWWLVGWIGTRYRRKMISDQSLALDAVWLVFGSGYVMDLAFFGAGWVLSFFVAFSLYKLAVRAANVIPVTDTCSGQNGPALLLLRVFSLGRRSGALFDIVTKRWRYLGNVELIIGTDLATATVAPYQFLNFVTGRLSGLFISDESSMDRSVQELDVRRDPDGRFRVNDFFCYANTWKAVLSRLIVRSDVVLMDLREFSSAKSGCIFELDAVINVAPLHRLVLVVDSSTDMTFLAQSLENSWSNMRSGSPNSIYSIHQVCIVRLGSLKYSELDNLLTRLCAAAST